MIPQVRPVQFHDESQSVARATRLDAPTLAPGQLLEVRREGAWRFCVVEPGGYSTIHVRLATAADLL